MTIIFLAAATLSAPKMKHNLDSKTVDAVLLKHLDHVTRYDHDFSQSKAGTCGVLFSLAKGLYEKYLKNKGAFALVDQKRDAEHDFLESECQHSSGAYTWVLLRVRKDGRACDVHIPINLFNYHLEDNDQHPLLNIHYAYEAYLAGDSFCYYEDNFEGEAARLGGIDVDEPVNAKKEKKQHQNEKNAPKIVIKESILEKKPDSFALDLTKVTKREQFMNNLLEDALKFAIAEVDLTQIAKGEETVADLRKEIEGIKKFINDNIDNQNEDIIIKQVDKLNNIVLEARQLVDNDSSDEEENDNDDGQEIDNAEEKINNNDEVKLPIQKEEKPYVFKFPEHMEYFSKLAGLFSGFDEEDKNDNDTSIIVNDETDSQHNTSIANDDENVEIEPLFHDIPDAKSEVNPHGLKLMGAQNSSNATSDNTPYSHLLRPNGLIGGSIPCNREHKLRIIDLYYAEATAANAEGHELYTENIVRCTVSVESAIVYKVILSMNNNDCYYGVRNDIRYGTISSIADNKVEYEVRRCQQMLSF